MILSRECLSDAALAGERAHIEDRVGASIEGALRFPRYFQIETTRLCNARCPFCAIEKWDKSTPFMSDDLFAKIVEEMAPHADWIRILNVQKAGEPLLDKKIYQRIRMLKEIGIRCVNMSTNASALTEENARKLLEAGLDELMMSIDSVERESYEKLRVGLDYDTVLANIRRFFSLRDELRPNLIIRVRAVSLGDIKDAETQARLQAWEEFWQPLRKPHDRIYMKRAHTWGNQVEWGDAIRNYSDVYHPCILPFSTMQICSSGKVALCPQDFDAVHDLGNIKDHSIEEIWRGEAMQNIRRLHLSGERNAIAMCRGCTLFDEELSLEKEKNQNRFSRKPVSALNEDGAQ